MEKIKLAISNIAWPRQDTDGVLKHLKSLGYNAIEIAPTRIWDNPLNASKQERLDYLKYVNDYGLSIASMHSLFFGLDDMNIFGNPDQISKMREYLRGLIELSNDLNIPQMVFGSPPQRNKKDIADNVAFEMACDFFYSASRIAERYNVKLLIEPLTKKETGFINTLDEGLALVNIVNGKGFGLHMDAKAIADELANNNVVDLLFKEHVPFAEHFHVNEADLGILSDDTDYHSIFGKMLNRYSYDKYVSLEMKTLVDYYSAIDKSTDVLKKYYDI